MAYEIKLLGPADSNVLDRVAPGVFDFAVHARWTAEFMADQRHHLIVAMDGPMVVGMVSAVHYVHPDKAPQLFINEVGVADSHRNKGIGKQLMAAILEHGRGLGCTEAWVGTETTNTLAQMLYRAAGGEREPDDFIIYTFPLTAEEPDAGVTS